MKAIFISVFLFIGLSVKADTQSGFMLSLEPNVMIGNRKSAGIGTNYFSGKNSLGIGVNFIYHKLLPKHFFINGYGQIFTLRGAVQIDYGASGFDNYSETHYDKQSYGFNYVTAFGLGVSGGYNIALNHKTSFDIGAGVHSCIAGMSSGNGILISLGNGNPYPAKAYEESLINTKFPTFLFGGDIMITYNFLIKRRGIFVGLHYCYNPGQQIKGNYQAFVDFPFAGSGTYSLATSYFGLYLGVNLGKER